MNIGGSGSTFAVPFVILLSKQLNPFKAIARVSLLFAFFNVNELLLFGLPIVLNPILLVPFFLAPFLNLGVALCMMKLGLFTIIPTSIPWMSAPLYSAYLGSHGSIWAIVTQALCIVLDGLVYFPFLVIASRQHTAPAKIKRLLGSQQDGFSAGDVEQWQSRKFMIQQLEQPHRLSHAQRVLNQIEHGEFQLYYQPKFDAKTLDIVGFEALLRLKERSGKLLSPSFLPILYEQGMSKAIDQKVISLAVGHLLYWRRLGLIIPTIAINFDKDFLLDKQAMRGFLNQASYHNLCFDIEITEHTYTTDISSLAAVVSRLQAAGHRVSIDDFGAGYSSLTLLGKLTANAIKLDAQFIAPDTEVTQQNTILLESSTRLCHDLEFAVVAEGIETLQQLRRAQQAKVDILQGYFLGTPMSHHKVADFINDARNHTANNASNVRRID